nr:MAG TPA: hypothetical protein [Caudoviricetes sp.]
MCFVYYIISRIVKKIKQKISQNVLTFLECCVNIIVHDM